MTSLWRHHPDPQDNRVKWIAVDSLTEIYQSRLHWAYGPDLHLVAKRDNLRAAARERIHDQDLSWFMGLKNEQNLTLYSMEDATQLQEACAWLRLGNDQAAMQQLGWSKKADWYQDMAIALTSLNLKGLSVSNGAVLKRKCDLFVEQGVRCLVHGNVGNEAARRMTDAGVERVVSLYASPLKPTSEDVAELYNREVELHGGGMVTVERVRQIIRENRHAWFALRHGNQEAERALAPHLKRKRASRPDALWYIDGTALQLLYMDDNGKVRSDLYIQYVTDAHTDAVVGYALGHTETSELVLSSLRKAVAHCGTMPDQAIYDHGSANMSDKVQKALNLLTRLHHPAAPGNAKAKRVEGVSGRIESSVMRLFGNFKGGNITAKSLQTRANAEHIKALVRDGGLPNLAEVITQVEVVIRLWNQEGNKGLNYAQVALNERRKANESVLIAALWQERPDLCTYMQHGLRVQINHTRYEYAVQSEPGLEDMEWRKRYLGDTFKLMCDPDDMEHRRMALIDVHTGALVAVAERKYEYAEAFIDRPEGEGVMLHKAIKDRKENVKQYRKNQEASNARLKELDFGVFDHRLLHKDQLNAIESEMSDRALGLLEFAEGEKRTPNTNHLLYGGDDATLELLD